MGRDEVALPMTVTHEPLKRGGTARDTGLSKVQRKLLLWLLKQEEAIRTSEDSAKIKEFNQKGIPWSAKRFYDDAYGEAMPKGQGQSISRSLKSLESSRRKRSPRGLIERYDTTGGTGEKGRTSHVKLTPEGRYAANFEREHGKTKRQILEQHKRNNMLGYLEQLRKNKEEFQEAIMHEKMGFGASSVNHPWEWNKTVRSNTQAFEDLYSEIIKRIYGLAVKLDMPRTSDEIEHLEFIGRHSSSLPF